MQVNIYVYLKNLKEKFVKKFVKLTRLPHYFFHRFELEYLLKERIFQGSTKK